jgi:hypothetical protein
MGLPERNWRIALVSSGKWTFSIRRRRGLSAGSIRPNSAQHWCVCVSLSLSIYLICVYILVCVCVFWCVSCARIHTHAGFCAGNTFAYAFARGHMYTNLCVWCSWASSRIIRTSSHMYTKSHACILI